MNYEKAIPLITDHCEETIKDFRTRATTALRTSMEEDRTIESADYTLADEIVRCIREWCRLNNCEDLDITTADIIYNL